MGIPQEKEERQMTYCYIKGLEDKASIPTDDLIPKTRRGKNQHSKAF